MLHALERGHTKFFRRFQGDRSEVSEGEKIREEDEITSTFLGPLDFMQPKEGWRIWREILYQAGRSDILPDSPPVCMELTLWPSRSVFVGSGIRVEPDATLLFEWKNLEKKLLLIEFKWGAPLSGDDQLHRQWRGYLNDEERKYSYHIFIAPEVSAGAAARDGDMGNVWAVNDDNRLLLLPWELIRSAVKSLADNNETEKPVNRWAGLEDRFLECIGVHCFHGFKHFNSTSDIQPLAGTPIFWMPFSGFSNIPNIEVSSIPSQSTLFFKICNNAN
jgi:hypothetical protein